jgi:hypothetical protein
MYLEYTRIPELDPPKFEFRWGHRAKEEVSRRELLQFVSLVSYCHLCVLLKDVWICHALEKTMCRPSAERGKTTQQTKHTEICYYSWILLWSTEYILHWIWYKWHKIVVVTHDVSCFTATKLCLCTSQLNYSHNFDDGLWHI